MTPLCGFVQPHQDPILPQRPPQHQINNKDPPAREHLLAQSQRSALRLRLPQSPPMDPWPSHSSPSHSPERTPSPEELHNPRPCRTPSPIRLSAQAQQPKNPPLARNETRPEPQSQPNTSALTTGNTQPRGPTPFLPPIVNLGTQGLPALPRQPERTNSPPIQGIPPANKLPPLTQNRGEIPPSQPLNLPPLRGPLPRTPSPAQHTPGALNHARDDASPRTTPKSSQSSPMRSPPPPILPPIRQSGNPTTSPVINPATNPDSSPSPNTRLSPNPGNQTSQTPNLPSIHNSGCGFESHHGPPPTNPTTSPDSGPPHKARPDLLADITKPPGWDTMSHKQREHWEKKQLRMMIPPPPPPPRPPPSRERLPLIPKPSNWASMTAKEKSNWLHKHK